MATITRKGRELAHELGLSGFGADAETCSLIMRHAASLQRLAEEECNGPGDWVNNVPYPEAGHIYDRWQERVERQTDQRQARVRELVKTLPGVTGVNLGGDPRGTVVKLFRADGKSNTWGGEESGWAVPL
jgi:hypothetical protein